MTDTEPETAESVDEEFSQYVATSLVKRERWKAELTDVLAKAKALLHNAKRLENQLSSDEYLGVADSNDWLGGEDLAAFTALMENAYSCLTAADAINRPHTGDPLWPQILPLNDGSRTEYAVEYTTPQDIQETCTGFTQRPKHHLGPFDSVIAARHKASRLLANGHVLTAEVKARELPGTTDWVDPATLKADDE